MLRPSDCSQSMDWMMDGISENTSRLQQQRACFVKAHLRPDDVILEVSDHQFFWGNSLAKKSWKYTLLQRDASFLGKHQAKCVILPSREMFAFFNIIPKPTAVLGIFISTICTCEEVLKDMVLHYPEAFVHKLIFLHRETGRKKITYT